MLSVCPFEGEEGWDALVQKLLLQNVTCGKKPIAEALAKKATLLAYKRNDEVIAEGELGKDLFFILTGSYDVMIAGQCLVTLQCPACFGELALVDSESRRTASVVTKDSGWLAMISEADFSAVAEEYPTLWHQIANEIINR